MLAWCSVGITVHGTLQSCASRLLCSIAHIRNGSIQLLTALFETKSWEMGFLPLRGGQLPCRIPKNTGLHLWKYEHKCNSSIRQLAGTRANPYRYPSSSLRSSLWSCWWLLLRGSSEVGKEPNFDVQSWTVGKVARSSSHLGFYHYL